MPYLLTRVDAVWAHKWRQIVIHFDRRLVTARRSTRLVLFRHTPETSTTLMPSAAHARTRAATRFELPLRIAGLKRSRGYSVTTARVCAPTPRATSINRMTSP